MIARSIINVDIAQFVKVEYWFNDIAVSSFTTPVCQGLTRTWPNYFIFSHSFIRLRCYTAQCNGSTKASNAPCIGYYSCTS